MPRGLALHAPARDKAHVSRRALVLVVTLCAACATRTPRLPYAGPLDDFLAAHPLSDGQNIRADEIGRTATASYHVVQVRGAESPHRHVAHDLTVVVLRGHGTLTRDTERAKRRHGSLAHHRRELEPEQEDVGQVALGDLRLAVLASRRVCKGAGEPREVEGVVTELVLRRAAGNLEVVGDVVLELDELELSPRPRGAGGSSSVERDRGARAAPAFDRCQPPGVGLEELEPGVGGEVLREPAHARADGDDPLALDRLGALRPDARAADLPGARARQGAR